jgi:uncharacterized protein (DUF983 family)
MNPQDEIKKQCPTCGRWDVYRAYVEDGGMGDWCPHCKKSTDDRKSTIIGIVAIFTVVIIFIIVNLVLHYAQKIYHKPQVDRCEVLEKELGMMKGEIDIYKHEIAILEKNLYLIKGEIEKIEYKLKSPTEYYYSENSYNNDYLKYKKLIRDYNENAENYNTLNHNHRSLIESYNSKVKEYSSLAKTAYSTWYIIPIPGKISKK